MNNKEKIKKIGTAIIIENSDGKFLLQLRDNKQTIKYPNCWVLFGGGNKKNETTEQTIVREIKEELNLLLEDFSFYRNFIYEDFEEKHLQYIYYKKWDLDISNLNLNEGQAMKFFSVNEIESLSFGFNIKEILNTYLFQDNLRRNE